MRGPQGSDLPSPPSSTCGQCGHRFPYLEDVGLEIAEYILEQHAHLCPTSPSQKQAQEPLWPEASGTSKLGSSSADDLTGPQRSTVASETFETVKKRRKYETDMMGRKAILEADPYGRNVTAKSIVCNICDKTIRLDRRNDYYPGLWVKHRDKCRTRPQPSKRIAREAAKEVVWGEKVGVVGKRKSTTHSGTPKPETPLRSRTLSPLQPDENFEPDARPRSWSGDLVGETSVHLVPAGGHVESLLCINPLPPIGNTFKERSNSVSILTTASPQMHWPADISRPSHAESAFSSREYVIPEIRRPRSSSINSSTAMSSIDSSHTGIEATNQLSLVKPDRVETPHSFTWIEDGDGDEDVKSDRYWSEAPFATGPEQWAERGRYRYSTRRELMRAFQPHRNEQDDEDVPLASPRSSSSYIPISSPDYVEPRELHNEG